MVGGFGSKMRWAVGMAGAVALAVGSTSPAMARGYHPGGGWGGPGGYGPPPPRHWRGRGLDAGDVIGIAALIGTVAVIASAASRNSDNRASYPNNDRDYRTAPDDNYRGGEYQYPDNGYSNEDYRGGDNYAGNYSGNGQAMGLNEAENACAAAVRDKAEGERGGIAQVVAMDAPRSAGQGGWTVDGRVEWKGGYRENYGEIRRFTCDIQGDRVGEVYISRDTVG